MNRALALGGSVCDRASRNFDIAGAIVVVSLSPSGAEADNDRPSGDGCSCHTEQTEEAKLLKRAIVSGLAIYAQEQAPPAQWRIS